MEGIEGEILSTPNLKAHSYARELKKAKKWAFLTVH